MNGDTDQKVEGEVDQDIEVIENQFLTFKINSEQYGVGIAFVMEIIEMIKVTPIPEMPDFIKGVINLRGKVIPVMDIRARFSMEEREYDDRTCIIVVKLEELEIGIIVDTVSEVVNIPKGQIEPAPQISKENEKKFVMGMGKIGDDVTILLDLDKMLFEKDVEKLIEVKDGK